MRGRPIVRNPLLKLLKKVVPVSTVIMTKTRPFFKAPSSRSEGTIDDGKVSWTLLFTGSLGTTIGNISDMTILTAFYGRE